MLDVRALDAPDQILGSGAAKLQPLDLLRFNRKDQLEEAVVGFSAVVGYEGVEMDYIHVAIFIKDAK